MTFWLLVIPAVVAGVYCIKALMGKRDYHHTRYPRRDILASRPSARAMPDEIRPPKKHDKRLPTPIVIKGKAYVNDADGVKVSGYRIRLTGLDSPEEIQLAKTDNGYWVNHGRLVKRALIRKIGGKQVRVIAEGRDKYGRVLGTVMYGNEDVGAWLVQNGYAIAAYSDKYKHLEREAKKSRRGMWGYERAYDPRHWRHR